MIDKLGIQFRVRDHSVGRITTIALGIGFEYPTEYPTTYERELVVAVPTIDSSTIVGRWPRAAGTALFRRLSLG